MNWKFFTILLLGLAIVECKPASGEKKQSVFSKLWGKGREFCGGGEKTIPSNVTPMGPPPRQDGKCDCECHGKGHDHQAHKPDKILIPSDQGALNGDYGYPPSPSPLDSNQGNDNGHEFDNSIPGKGYVRKEAEKLESERNNGNVGEGNDDGKSDKIGIEFGTQMPSSPSFPFPSIPRSDYGFGYPPPVDSTIPNTGMDNGNDIGSTLPRSGSVRKEKERLENKRKNDEVGSGNDKRKGHKTGNGIGFKYPPPPVDSSIPSPILDNDSTLPRSGSVRREKERLENARKNSDASLGNDKRKGHQIGKGNGIGTREPSQPSFPSIPGSDYGSHNGFEYPPPDDSTIINPGSENGNNIDSTLPRSGSVKKEKERLENERKNGGVGPGNANKKGNWNNNGVWNGHESEPSRSMPKRSNSLPPSSNYPNEIPSNGNSDYPRASPSTGSNPPKSSRPVLKRSNSLPNINFPNEDSSGNPAPSSPNPSNGNSGYPPSQPLDSSDPAKNAPIFAGTPMKRSNSLPPSMKYPYQGNTGSDPAQNSPSTSPIKRSNSLPVGNGPKLGPIRNGFVNGMASKIDQVNLPLKQEDVEQLRNKYYK